MTKILREVHFKTPITLPVFGSLNYEFKSVTLDTTSDDYSESEFGFDFATTDVDHNAARFGVSVPVSNISHIISVEVSD